MAFLLSHGILRKVCYRLTSILLIDKKNGMRVSKTLLMSPSYPQSQTSYTTEQDQKRLLVTFLAKEESNTSITKREWHKVLVPRKLPAPK